MEGKQKKTKSECNKIYYALNTEKVKAHMAEKIQCDTCSKQISRSSKYKHKTTCYPLANRDEILARYRK